MENAATSAAFLCVCVCVCVCVCHSLRICQLLVNGQSNGAFNRVNWLDATSQSAQQTNQNVARRLLNKVHVTDLRSASTPSINRRPNRQTPSAELTSPRPRPENESKRDALSACDFYRIQMRFAPLPLRDRIPS